MSCPQSVARPTTAPRKRRWITARTPKAPWSSGPPKAGATVPEVDGFDHALFQMHLEGSARWAWVEESAFGDVVSGGATAGGVSRRRPQLATSCPRYPPHRPSRLTWWGRCVIARQVCGVGRGQTGRAWRRHSVRPSCRANRGTRWWSSMGRPQNRRAEPTSWWSSRRSSQTRLRRRRAHCCWSSTPFGSGRHHGHRPPDSRCTPFPDGPPPTCGRAPSTAHPRQKSTHPVPSGRHRRYRRKRTGCAG